MNRQLHNTRNLNESQALRLTSEQIDERYIRNLLDLRQQAANKPKVFSAISALIRRKAQRIITNT